jgi:hypothetical protein
MAQDTELWGTFAVDDHLRRRPFAAEVILFDRLVIPTPPAWTPDALRDWPRSWHPERLRDLMNALGDYAVPMPWDETKRKRWEQAYSEHKQRRTEDAAGVSFDVQNIRTSPQDTPAKYMTRVVITSIIEEADNELVNNIRRLSLPITTQIETVVAYGSLEAFKIENLDRQVSPADRSFGTQNQGDALLLSWDFFVPEDQNLSDIRLLEKLVDKIEKDTEFRDHRRAFNELRRSLSNGRASPQEAMAEIERRLVDYNRLLRSIGQLNTARTVLTYAAIAAPLVDFIAPGVGTGSGVVLGLASQTWSKWAPDPKPGPAEAAVAMVHDLRKEFGLQR